MVEDVEEARDFLLSWSNKKLEQHIAYILGSIGAFYTILNIPDKYDPMIIKLKIVPLTILVVFFFVFYNAGRIIHWSVIHQYILTHYPRRLIITENNRYIYSDNMKWRLLRSAYNDLIQKPPYDDLNREYSNVGKIRLFIARRFNGLSVLIFCLICPIVLWIVLFIWDYMIF